MASGLAILNVGFPAEVFGPVALHAAAKRYLVANLMYGLRFRY